MKKNSCEIGPVLMTLVLFTVVTMPSMAQETDPNPTEVTPMPPPPAPVPEPESAPDPPSTPETAPATQNNAPIATAPTPQTNPYIDLRKQPKKLHIVEGQSPPLGYVEVERKKRRLIIAGSALFGGTYALSVAISPLDRSLLIPILGPAIAGFQFDSTHNGYDDDYNNERDDDAEYTARLYGILGTLAQTTGVTLFVIGMLSSEKMWLRQDIAGVRFQIAPTLVGYRNPGLGVKGTF